MPLHSSRSFNSCHATAVSTRSDFFKLLPFRGLRLYCTMNAPVAATVVVLAFAMSNGTETVDCAPQVQYCADASIARHRPDRRSPSAAQTAPHSHRGHLASSVVRFDGHLTLCSWQTLVKRRYYCSRAFQHSKVQQILKYNGGCDASLSLADRWRKARCFPSSQHIPHELPHPSCVAALRLPAKTPSHNHYRLRGGLTRIWNTEDTSGVALPFLYDVRPTALDG